jgi:hypothetical protein
MKPYVLLTLISLSCSSPSFDAEKERKLVIQQLLDAQNQSLVNKDVDGAVSSVPDSGDVFIAQGEIFKRTKEEERKHMQDEIRDVVYLRFAHLTEPSIKFLDGGKACYGTAQIKIDYALTADTTKKENEFIYSILFVGEKQNNKWVMTAFSQSDKTNVD